MVLVGLLRIRIRRPGIWVLRSAVRGKAVEIGPNPGIGAEMFEPEGSPDGATPSPERREVTGNDRCVCTDLDQKVRRSDC